MNGHDAIKLFGYDAIKLRVAHGPWNVNLVDFQQYLLLQFSLRPQITVPMKAFQIRTESYYGASCRNIIAHR